MKVLHLISGGDKGGAKTHMFALLDEQCKLCDVTVVCLMRGVFYEEILERDVRVVLMEQKTRFDLSVVNKLRDMIRNEGFDIINAHGARANFIAKKLIGRIDVPVATTIHSDYLLDFDSFFKKLVFERLNRSALKKIKYKIAVSDAFRDMLISRGFMPNDILTVYNGMDFTTKIDPAPREEFAQKYGVPLEPDTVYVGIAARFDYVKGVDVFLRAAKAALEKRGDLRFVIAGEGDEKENLMALARELRIADRVHFTGFVSPVYDFLSFIDINTLTSRSESFPYSILEGARLSLPTVAASVGGIPHLISDGETGYLFDSEDYAACAEKILALAGDPEKRASLGAALYEKASTRFSNQALAENYIENYKSFICKFNREKRYDVILSGYYGFGNFGDDIILSTILQKIREERPGCETLILSRDPAQTMRTSRVDSINRYNFFAVRKAMKTSRAYVNGGGTLLTDVTSTHSLVYYASLIRMAKKLGLSTLVLANGVGPFRREKNKRRAIRALECTDVITLRDKGSYDFVRENLPDADAKMTADIIFTYCEPVLRQNNRAKKGVESLGIDGKYFIVSLREFAMCGADFEENVAAACSGMCEKYGLRAVFLPMQYEKDLKISNETAKMTGNGSIVIPRSLDRTERIELISGAEFTLGMRLHSLMVSASLSVPLVALSYDLKIENFIRENDLGACLKASEVKRDVLFDSMEECYTHGSENPAYSEFIREMRRRSDENVSTLLAVIDRK